MLLLHLSDLHLSRYGETRYWTQLDDSDDRWEVLQRWQRWRIEGKRDRKDRPERLRVVDPEGVVHAAKKWPSKKDDRAIAGLLQLAMERHMTSAEALVDKRPSAEDLAALLRIDPDNTNLRFIELLDYVLPLEPDVIVITGDMTDNGFGYGLIEHYLEPWIKGKRLFVVPGNHDTYELLPRRGRKARVVAREDRYREFAEHVGNTPEECGAYLRCVDDLCFVGLSSCKQPRTPLSASGEVSKEQLQWLAEQAAENEQFRGARLRICLVHHHLMRIPYEPGRGAPMEMGLKLRNGREVMQACADAQIDMIFNGHRHHGYTVQLPGHPLVISSPSSTLGCKSTDMRYVWLVELAQRYPYPHAHRLSEDRASPLEDAPTPEETETVDPDKAAAEIEAGD